MRQQIFSRLLFVSQADYSVDAILCMINPDTSVLAVLRLLQSLVTRSLLRSSLSDVVRREGKGGEGVISSARESERVRELERV